MNEMAQVHEKIGLLRAKVESAHIRTDKLEQVLNDDIAEIKADIKTLMADKHKLAGIVSTIVIIGSVAGSILGFIINKLWH